MKNFALAPVAAAALFAASCSGESRPAGPPPAPTTSAEPTFQSEALNHDASPEAQAHQIEVALNAGKKVTGVTVEQGYEIPLQPGQIPDGEGAISIFSPIKIKDGTYLYTRDNENDGPGQPALKVGLLQFTGKLLVAPTMVGKKPEAPKETTAGISAVYNQYQTTSTEHPATERYYVVSSNQAPGRNYNDQSETVGQIAWYGK